VKRALLALGVVAGAVAISLWPRSAPGPGATWQDASLRFDVLDATAITVSGPTRLFVVTFAPGTSFVPHHYRSEGWDAPRPIDGWAAALSGQVVCNAGQFDPSLQHLGWLKADGRWLPGRQSRAWMGLLLSASIDPALPAARIADLETMDVGIAEHYRHVVQSMMLFDAQGRRRVRRSDKAASRMVVAEDTRGRIVLVATAGEVRLADLADWLLSSPLQLVRAMNLDGGHEAQLAIRTEGLALTLHGSALPYPIPAVIEAVAPLRAGDPLLRAPPATLE
jgi:hypothetical protein